MLLSGSALAFSDQNASPVSAGLTGKPVDPFSSPARVRVLLFVRTDCPITNRYAPELQRIAGEFSSQSVRFWLVYPDKSATTKEIESHVAQYHFPGTPVLDPAQLLVQRAQAQVAPEAAVFDRTGNLVYHGRIDDRWVDFGKARAEAQTHDLQDVIRNVLAGRPVIHSWEPAVGCSLADLR